MRIAFASGIENLLRRIDQSTAGRLSGLESGLRESNIASMARRIAGDESAVTAADYVVERTPDLIAARQKAPADREPELRKLQREQVMADLMQQGGMGAGYSAREALAPHFARPMNRGLFGGERGLGESAAMLANRPMVRRGGLGAAGLGAAAGTGALLTEGAQQLMTLMDFLQAGQETRERAEQSPLT